MFGFQKYLIKPAETNDDATESPRGEDEEEEFLIPNNQIDQQTAIPRDVSMNSLPVVCILDYFFKNQTQD
ncbi:unnamed protein product [Brachionus calyciflorus]|uniref:Uncharacterized protein n=1 Tax=Brachionus calyciflorus TaxID=104777 RepID=A0A813Z2R7_9BILA|nr:unnamed protein product [Brachionus calyciflorus]